MKRIGFDTIVNVATLIACAAVSVAAYQFSHSTARASAPAPAEARPTVKIGDKLDLPDTVAAKPALLFYVSSTCHFCTESMPFYQRLVKRDDVRSGLVPLVVASPQKEPEVRAYLGAHKISAAAFVDGMAAGINTRATPTLILVNPDGTVRKTWTGQLLKGQELEVEAALSDLSKSGPSKLVR